MWPDRRLQDLFGIELPILLAPMAGVVYADLAVAVAEAGGLGSLPCAMFSLEQARAEFTAVRKRTSKPINLNFFCHQLPQIDQAREARWRERLKAYYQELGITPETPIPTSNRTPFDATFCELVEELKPEVVSFHFGLPEAGLVKRVKQAGCKLISSASTVDEAIWLEAHGCDAVIAQGSEAGGHRAMFLTDDVATQIGTMALLPQVVDAVKVPVIAAGAITDARGIVAAFALGASAVQIGTAYMFCPEAKIAAPHRQVLKDAKKHPTAITNLFTGRPARSFVNRVMREVGPMSDLAPQFPLAGGALMPLRAKSEPQGSGDFMALWSGQAAALAREMPAGELTTTLIAEAKALTQRLA
jgi:nitronate monooxygenase